MDRWSIAHRYNKLVKAGLAAPLTADDGEEYILKANEEYEPVYWRLSDNTIMTPGGGFWSRMRDAIDRADLDSLDTGLVS